MCYHTKGGQKVKLSKAHRRTKREKEREREKERKRRTPSARRTNEEAFAKKAQKTNEKEEEKEGYFSLSVCLVFSLLFSFFFFFSEKRISKLSPTFFFKGGWWFRCKLHAQFLYICARALSSNTLPERERER